MGFMLKQEAAIQYSTGPVVEWSSCQSPRSQSNGASGSRLLELKKALHEAGTSQAWEAHSQAGSHSRKWGYKNAAVAWGQNKDRVTPRERLRVLI